MTQHNSYHSLQSRYHLPGKFYFVRKGQPLPDGMTILRTSKETLICEHPRENEAFNRLQIDAMRHGYNAVVDVEFDVVYGFGSHSILTGKPALVIVDGDNNTPKLSGCTDIFTNLLYCKTKSKKYEVQTPSSSSTDIIKTLIFAVCGFVFAFCFLAVAGH